MNKEALVQYLLEFSKEGYAKDPGTKNKDGSTTIRHRSKDGLWSTVDTYWGGEPYAGCETVRLDEKPVWSLVYYGSVDSNETDIAGVYSHLRKALDSTDPDFPVRGPKALSEGKFKYENNWSGTIEKFHGQEEIYIADQQVYSASYMGGLVDQRGE